MDQTDVASPGRSWTNGGQADGPRRGQHSPGVATGTSCSSGQLPAPADRGSTSHLQAAVDRDDAAGDVAGVVVGQESHRPGDLPGVAEAADGNGGDDLVEDVLGHGGHHLGVGVAGGDAVDGDAFAGDLEGEAFGEAEQSRFGGGVVGLADVAGLADHGAEGDDPAETVLQHVVEDRLGQVEGAGEVDAQDGVPVVDGRYAYRLDEGDAGEDDERVDRRAGR